jgi:AraC-like DNA-binding protein
MRARAPGRASVILLRPVVAAAIRDGVDPASLLAALGVDAATLADRDATVDGPTIHATWQECAARTRDADFGLHVGERLTPGDYEVIDYLGLSSSCFRETIERLCRYYRILSDNVEITLETHGDVGRLVHRPRVGPPESWRHAWECFFSGSVTHARRALGAEWSPLAVELMHAAPADTREHARIFRAPVRFSQPLNALSFRLADAERPLPTADPVLGRLLTGYAEEVIAQIPIPDAFVARARAAVLDELRGGDPSIDALARRLAVSRRTLQRRLGEAGTSHVKLVDECRHQLARHYLGDVNLSLGEIGYLLGFAQPNAFHRAFRRWTGQTPAAFRSALSESRR